MYVGACVCIYVCMDVCMHASMIPFHIIMPITSQTERQTYRVQRDRKHEV